MVMVVLAQVIRRVAELQQLVEDAENYLSDADGETTETESVRSDQYGRLKHSDSLLLLTQVNKLILYHMNNFLHTHTNRVRSNIQQCRLHMYVP